MGDQRGVPWEAGNFVPLFSYMSREIVKGIDSYINNGSLGLFLLLQLWIVSSRKLLRSGEARWHYGPKRSCAAAAEQDEAVQVYNSRAGLQHLWIFTDTSKNRVRIPEMEWEREQGFHWCSYLAFVF